MTIQNKQLGFSAIELMITLFIAVSFFTTGFQIYSLITTDGDETRSRNRANNIVYDYLQRYKPDPAVACVAAQPVNNQAVTATNLTNVTVSITISCPVVNGVSQTKETATVSYGIPQKTVTSTIIIDSKPITCPTGFIVVPGSETYGTSDFCVMKYEAKVDENSDGIGDTTQTTGSNTWPANTHPISSTRKLVSTAAGYPVANISQATAITAASSTDFVRDCLSGCHLLTEAERMTIAQNVISVAENWSNGVVGSGYISSGHNDGAPANALTADTNDLNGYLGTGQSSPSGQKRTLTLTNGEVIWDFAGNVWELTTGQMTGGQPNGMPTFNIYEWTAVSGGTFAVNPYPSGTGLSGSNAWNSTNGIGQIYGHTSEVALRSYLAGGSWGSINYAGVLYLNIGSTPSATSTSAGFRVAR